MDDSYDVVFFNDSQPSNKCILASEVPTLEQAREYRKLSGDVVVYTGTVHVVPDDAWLWPWEKNNINSYAKKKVDHAIEEWDKIDDMFDCLRHSTKGR